MFSEVAVATMGVAGQLKTVSGLQGDRLSVIPQPQRQLPLQDITALLGAVAQVPLTTASTGLQLAFEHGEGGRHTRRNQNVGNAVGEIQRAPLIRPGHPRQLLGFWQIVKIGGRHLEGFADRRQIRHGGARQTALVLDLYRLQGG